MKQERFLTGLRPFALISAVAALAALGFSGKLCAALRTDISSDFAYGPLVVNDIIENGNWLLRGWYIHNSSGLLNNIPFLAAFFRAFGASPVSARLAGLLIFMLSVLVIYGLSSRLYGRTAGITAGLYLLAVPLYPAETAIKDIHISAYIFSFLSLLMLLSISEREKSGRPSLVMHLGLFAVSFINVFSDPIFIPIFIAPLMAVLGIQFIYGRGLLSRKTSSAVAAYTAASAFTSLYAQGAVSRFGLNIAVLHADFIEAGGLSANFLTYAKSLALVFGFSPDGHGAFAVIVVVINVAFFIFAFYAAVRALTVKASEESRFVEMFMVFMFLALSVSFIVKQNIANRYLLALIYPPAIYIAKLFAEDRPAKGRAFKRAGAAVLACFCILNSLSPFSLKQYSHKELVAEYLESQSLEYGYSSFWDANIYTFISGGNIKVRPVEFANYGLRPFYWQSKVEWYEPSSHMGPTFMLVPRDETRYGFRDIEPWIVESIAGPAGKKLHFEGYDIYVWPYNISARMIR